MTEVGSQVAVTVRDEGSGVAPEFVESLFVPYATTKETGTGLGLAISQRIAHEHDGDLRYLGPNGARGRRVRAHVAQAFRRTHPVSETDHVLDPRAKLYVALGAAFVTCLIVGDVIGGKNAASPVGAVSVGMLAFPGDLSSDRHRQRLLRG